MRQVPGIIPDVVERQLCAGCGACAYLSPGRLRMVDTVQYGRRPVSLRDGPETADTREALAACPGAGLDQGFDRGAQGLLKDLAEAWGPVFEVWEGFAADPEIRRAGSSGGAATALALYCIERGGMFGTLHAAARGDVPYLNETVLSRTRLELLARTGSRYAPASPCDGLQLVEDAPAPCVFIGKPCDVAAVEGARRVRPRLDEKLGLTIGFFCAGTPSLKGTLDLLAKVGVEDPSSVVSLRYRGNGWPGRWTVRFRRKDGTEDERSQTYEESWGFLQSYRQWRCYVCADHTGEFADIAVGDPWYRKVEPGEAGRSLIVARTERGVRIMHAAAAAGYLVLEKSDPGMLARSQPGLEEGRSVIWGRILALRLVGAGAPKYRGFNLFRLWWRRLSAWKKIHSVLGTVKRAWVRRLRVRAEVVPWEPGGSGRTTPGARK